MKNEKAITLIALIITIIVLLILAGISIGTLMGEGGILSKAGKAKEETQKAEYQEELKIIGLGLQPDRKIYNWTNQEYMNIYEEEIEKDNIFEGYKNIRQFTNVNNKEIIIEVITKEGWYYWVTENNVEYKGTKEEVEYPIINETDIYASLNGNTLAFFASKEEAEKFADTEEHLYPNIRGEIFEKEGLNLPNTPWINELNQIQTINFVDEIVPLDMSCYFSDLTQLTKIENIHNLKTDLVTNMYALFFDCHNLTSLDLSSFNTENVTNMNLMFYNCNKLTSLNVSEFNTSNVTNMESLFKFCGSIQRLNLRNWDTRKNTDMTSMFEGCEKLEQINWTQEFNTSEVFSMAQLFFNCYSLKQIDVSMFDTSKVELMNSMFKG